MLASITLCDTGTSTSTKITSSLISFIARLLNGTISLPSSPTIPI